METKDKGENSADKDMPLLRRPNHKIGFYSTYRFLERGNITLEVVYVGERDDKDFSSFPASRVVLPSYTIVNFAVQFNAADWLTITGKIDNLFDTDYEDILGYATAGLSGYLGLKINL